MPTIDKGEGAKKALSADERRTRQTNTGADLRATQRSKTVSAKRNASMVGETIGARVRAKNEALRAIGEEEDAMDPAVDTAMEDLVGMLEGASMGGRRRGGAKVLDALGGLFSGLKGKAGEAGSGLDAAAATVVNNLGTIGAVGTTVTVLNHPTVVGNLAQVFAEVLKQGTNATITSTWGAWGAALGQLRDAATTVVATIGAQTVQGPVVPVAMAVLVTMIRANKSGRSFAQVLKDDASALTSAASRAVTGQMQAATNAYGKEAAAIGIRQLKEVAGRIDRPMGPGAAAMSSAAATGAPAMGSTGVVAATPSKTGAIPSKAREFAASVAPAGEDWKAATTLAGLATAAAAPGKSDMEDEEEDDDAELGGRRRRKTRKGRKPRRRTTLRKRRSSRKAIKFVY
jgi:hypothetical protein